MKIEGGAELSESASARITAQKNAEGKKAVGPASPPHSALRIPHYWISVTWIPDCMMRSRQSLIFSMRPPGLPTLSG